MRLDNLKTNQKSQIQYFEADFLWKVSLNPEFRINPELSPIKSVKQFGSRSGPTFCGPNLGTNCL